MSEDREGTQSATTGRRPRNAPQAQDKRSMWVEPLFRALLWGVGFFLFFVALMSIDYVATHDVPVEQARVTDQHLTGERTTCGRGPFNNADEQATVFIVDHPRAGLPGTFTVRGCSMEDQPGDVVPVARTGPTPDYVYLDPITGFGWMLLVSASIGVAIGTAVFAWYALSAQVSRRLDRRRELGHSPGGTT